MADPDRIVAVGLLTANDLAALGQNFRRSFPIDDASSFADLLDAIDAAEKRAAASPDQDALSQKRL